MLDQHLLGNHNRTKGFFFSFFLFPSVKMEVERYSLLEGEKSKLRKGADSDTAVPGSEATQHLFVNRCLKRS